MDHKKPGRLCADERLQMGCCGGRKRAPGTRGPIALPQGPKQGLNQSWPLDFGSDTLTAGPRYPPP